MEEVTIISSGVVIEGKVSSNGNVRVVGNIKGDITMYLELYFARQILKSDTIAFEIYIRDRDLNNSNVVETPLFLIER